MLFLHVDLPTGNCVYIYIHTNHVIIDSSFIMHLKTPCLEVFFVSVKDWKAKHNMEHKCAEVLE
jgi:hypothetical protein